MIEPILYSHFKGLAYNTIHKCYDILWHNDIDDILQNLLFSLN